MSDEPRRKRKWDTQGEENDVAAVDSKRALVEESGQSNVAESPSGAQDVAVGGADQSPADAAAAAAAIAAAKLNAMLVAKGQAPASSTSEINNSGAPAPAAPATAGSDDSSAAGRPASSAREANRERDEFFKDIDINDVKHRYILTKGSVQTQIQRDTTADVTTRGKYYPDRSMATEKDPPLYLHVTAMTQEALDLALQKIDELINEAQNPAPLPPQRDSFAPPSRMPGGPPLRHHQPFPFQTRVEINMDSERTFNVRAKIVGPGGQYVKHVQNETRTRVKLKGQGSGFLEVETGREAEEPLYISIVGNTQEEVDEAERLCKDLVETVRAEYERMKSRPPAPYEPYGDRGSRHYGGRPSYHSNGDGYNRQRDHYDRDRRYDDGRQHRQPYDRPPYDRHSYDRPSYDRQPYDHQRQQNHQATQSHHQYGYNQHYQSGPPPPHGMGAPVNPPLPSGPPPPLPSGAPPAPGVPAPPTSDAAAGTLTAPEAGSVATSETATSAAGAPAAAQAYTYDQYEAYNQYYYQQQQQYYQQYGQYYQQYAQPGAEHGQQGAAGSSAAAPVSSDPALAYYGYAYTATALPGSETTGAFASAAPGTSAAPAAAGESASAPPPPPPGAPSSSDSQPPPPQPEASA
ncbi:hypothetical protein BGZ97_011377 [Linnemannia gamsii]|uniref:K Homology domain-containing protein n=1 Tax=Linnemannia gamsii TaxID=64522 RepID=A0A9P6UN51_9FUNG|nr:hypothetical protein BGZ97_011377 [Linnemannia gamsii]